MSAKATGAGERMVTLDVSLLGRDYKVACKADEQAELKDAVAFLERRMREIRESSKTTSIERVAVMAALNLAHDFQRSRATAKAAPASQRAGRRRRSGRRAATDREHAVRDRPGAARKGEALLTRRRGAYSIHVPCGVRVVHTLFEPMLPSEVAAPFAGWCALPSGSA